MYLPDSPPTCSLSLPSLAHGRSRSICTYTCVQVCSTNSLSLTCSLSLPFPRPRKITTASVYVCVPELKVCSTKSLPQVYMVAQVCSTKSLSPQSSPAPSPCRPLGRGRSRPPGPAPTPPAPPPPPTPRQLTASTRTPLTPMTGVTASATRPISFRVRATLERIASHATDTGERDGRVAPFVPLPRPDLQVLHTSAVHH
jgi:hypothetical protein